MIGILNIDKENIPYSFNFIDNDETYVISVTYNSYNKGLYFSLAKDGKSLVDSKRAVIGQPLFEEFAYDNNNVRDKRFFNNNLIVPYDLSWQEDLVTLDNIQETVYLYVMDRG